ncbi:alpha/beta hydrolase [Microbacterium sp. BWT-B31]|uniref:alpha/beta fold hydrolase n=1 Tax=Microbacterium sp. BWT-B31 TaxID=3232072 RepID=UPI003529CA6E
MTLFDGITERRVQTPRLTVGLLEREGDDPTTPPEQTVVLIHGNGSSSLFWQELMQDLPTDLRVIAIDLRGYGASEHAPIDATRGVRDFSDDVRATLEVLGVPTAHFVGWSMGAGVIMQYALDHPVLSLTLESPVSPYGFGGTRRDGSRLTDDDAGVGGGAGNAEFAARMEANDMSDEAPVSPRNVFRAHYVAEGYATDHEDVWVQSINSTSTAEGNYPGDSVPSDNWPGFAAGTIGVLNTLAPKYFDVSGIVGLADKPPILWVHGLKDVIVSDSSFYDLNNLGAMGVVPGWPGDEVAAVQPMVTQTRDVLDAYEAAGGQSRELALEDTGHTPHLERPIEFRRALLEVIGYVGQPASPAPPTEQIVLRSSD